MTKTIRCRQRVWYDDTLYRDAIQVITLYNCKECRGTIAGYTPEREYITIAAADVLEVIA